jgi:hypothetical protein
MKDSFFHPVYLDGNGRAELSRMDVVLPVPNGAKDQ